MSEALSSAFAPLEVHRNAGRSEFVGQLEDQSALYGMLNQLQAFGLELHEVRVVAGVVENDQQAG